MISLDFVKHFCKMIKVLPELADVSKTDWLQSTLSTDRKNFQSREFRAIIETIKYPGVAQLVARLLWDVVVERFCDFGKTAESPAVQGF